MKQQLLILLRNRQFGVVGHSALRRIAYTAVNLADAALPANSAIRARLITAPRRLAPSHLRTGLQRHFANTLAIRQPISTVVTAVDGFKLSANTEDVIQRVIAVSGQWEPTISSVVRALLREGDAFIDVGANIGYYTLLAHSRVGADGFLVSFEADPDIFRYLQSNLERNGLFKEIARNVAITDKPGKVFLISGGPANWGHTMVSANLPAETAMQTNNSASVRSDSLDQQVSNQLDSQQVVIKIDIEGAEQLASVGLERMLRSGLPEVTILMECTPAESGPDTNNQWATRLAYRHGLAAYEVTNGYGLDEIYPDRIGPVRKIDRVSDYPTDILLIRGAESTRRLKRWLDVSGVHFMA